MTANTTAGVRSARIDSCAITRDRRLSLPEASAARGRRSCRSARRSSRIRAAGTKVIISRNAVPMPIAARTPKSVMAGTGFVTLVRNPRAVVMVARTSAIPTVVMAVDAAWSTDAPSAISSR